jgi:aminoglycoside phosphotransferase (APT) family kinase protein
VITALNNTDVPVPKTYALCEDTEIIGTAFYLMEFMNGRVLWDPSMADSSKEEALGVYSSMNSTLAKLHSVDPLEVDLESFGKPGNYV